MARLQDARARAAAGLPQIDPGAFFAVVRGAFDRAVDAVRVGALARVAVVDRAVRESPREIGVAARERGVGLLELLRDLVVAERRFGGGSMHRWRWRRRWLLRRARTRGDR